MDLSVIGPWLVAAVLVAISLGAFFKGVTGLGLPLFAVPAIATITSVEEAVVLMIIPFLLAALVGATGVSAHIVAPYFHDPKIKPEAYAFLVASAFLVMEIKLLADVL